MLNISEQISVDERCAMLAELARQRIIKGRSYGADMRSSRDLCFADAGAVADRIIALRTQQAGGVL